jgi:hypothetical protein
MHSHSPKLAVLLCLGVVPLSSCFVRKRVVTLPASRPGAPLLRATRDQLIQRVHQVADPIQSFSIQMDMSPSVGSLYQGEVKDYATLGGYILFQKPDSIRVLGQDPVMHTTVFDMVSAGEDFRIHIPSKSQFLQGRNDAPPISKNQVENLRPTAFLTSLMIQAPDPDADITLLEEDTNEREAVYILLIVRRGRDEPWLVRSLHFDRHDLQIVRQKTFDSSGGVLSDTKYSGWKVYGGISFPSEILIQRPQDHYEVMLNVVNMRINTADITAEKFILNQPSGTQLRQLSQQ